MPAYIVSVSTVTVDQQELTRLAQAYDAVCCSPLAWWPHVRLSDPLTGDKPFTLWDYQQDLLNTMHTQRRVIVLKARQLGVSWLLAAYALWTAAYKRGSVVLMLSKRQDEASALLDRCWYIYQRLPPWLQPGLLRHNQTELSFDACGSKILALPATEDAGRGEAATLVLVDEAAYHPYAERNYAAYKPTVDAGGRLVIVSTANGRGNWYHSMWSGAPGNGFTPVFLRWDLRPGRDADWWAQQQLEYQATPRLLVQEYPDTPEVSFIASGGCLWEIDAITGFLRDCKAPIEQSNNEQLRIWQRPIPGRRYVAGADVAEGRDAGNDRLDYSVCAVYDWQTCTNVATLRGQWPTDVFAQLVDALGRRYNAALLGVERNNHGHAVLSRLRALEYPSLYYHTEERLIRGHVVKARPEAGWPTTAKTKPVLEQEMGALIASGGIVSWDGRLWDECLSYTQHGDGKTGATDGCHDDLAMATMIALQMRHRGQRVAMPLSINAQWRG